MTRKHADIIQNEQGEYVVVYRDFTPEEEVAADAALIPTQEQMFAALAAYRWDVVNTQPVTYKTKSNQMVQLLCDDQTREAFTGKFNTLDLDNNPDMVFPFKSYDGTFFDLVGEDTQKIYRFLLDIHQLGYTAENYIRNQHISTPYTSIESMKAAFLAYYNQHKGF